MLWLPPSERDRHADAARQWEARTMAFLEEKAFWNEWNADLRQIDHYLELIRIPDNDQVEPPLRAGFWHVIRRNPGTVASLVKIVETPDGGYKDPDSSLFDEIRKMDLWSDRSGRERREREAELTQVRDRRRAREDRLEEGRDRFKALENPGVSMTSARPWSYRTEARRG